MQLSSSPLRSSEISFIKASTVVGVPNFLCIGSGTKRWPGIAPDSASTSRHFVLNITSAVLNITSAVGCVYTTEGQKAKRVMIVS